MVILLEVTVPFLGRFQVLDDYSIEDVSLLPDTEYEVDLLQKAMTPHEWSPPRETLGAALQNVFDCPWESVTVHSEVEEVLGEPEQNEL